MTIPDAIDRMPDGRLLAAALGTLRVTNARAASIMGTDPRTVQRLKSGARPVTVRQWRAVARALDARSLHKHRARELAEAVRRRIPDAAPPPTAVFGAGTPDAGLGE